MSLGTISIGWLAVFLLFAATARWTRGSLPRRAAVVSAVESGVLTLLAALWFGTAGHGGWLLVFGLLGVLVGGSQPFARIAFPAPEARPDWRAFLVDLARYVAAGGLLAWRLG